MLPLERVRRKNGREKYWSGLTETAQLTHA